MHDAVGIFSRRNQERFSIFKNSKSRFLMKVSVKHWNFQIKLNCGVENTPEIVCISKFELKKTKPMGCYRTKHNLYNTLCRHLDGITENLPNVSKFNLRVDFINHFTNIYLVTLNM